MTAAVGGILRTILTAIHDDALARVRALLEDDPVPQVREEAARALGAAGDPEPAGVEPLLRALEDPSHGVRRVATLALGRIRDPRAVDALLDVLATRPELWQEASAALITAGGPSLLPRLVPLLESESSHVRCGTVRAIAGLTRRSSPAESEPMFVYTDEEGHRHPLF